MCLDIKRFSFAKRAKTDIVCYKFLVKNDYNELATPYRYRLITIGSTYESELKVKSRFFKNSRVEDGLHSLVNKSDVSRCFRGTRGVVVKCIIPAGSRYFEGHFDIYMSYASDKITYVEIID